MNCYINKFGDKFYLKEDIIDGQYHLYLINGIYHLTNKDHTINYLIHREDGPAIESCLFKAWIVNGKQHRDNGPAIEYSNGNKYWFYNGEEIYCNDNDVFLKIINQ